MSARHVRGARRGPYVELHVEPAALAVLALGMAPTGTEARWTGNVMVVNLMANHSCLVNWAGP